MTITRFNSAQRIIDHDADWTSFKQWLEGPWGYLRYTWSETDAAYTVIAVDGTIMRMVGINKTDTPSDDQTDFETNWKVNATLVEVTESGRQIMQPVAMDRGMYHWYHSVGDDTGRGDGPLITLSATGTLVAGGTDYKEWKYNDWVVMTGGEIDYANAALGDYISFAVKVPAATASSTPGTGNVNKVSLGGGLNRYVPATNGSHTINLSSVGARIAMKGSLPGSWDWSWPDTGVGTVSAREDGPYVMLDFDLTMTRFIPAVGLLGSRTKMFRPENVHPMSILPQWVLRADLTTINTVHTVDAVIEIIAGRKVPQ